MSKNFRLFNTQNNRENQGYQAEIDRIIDYRKASGKGGMRQKIGSLLDEMKINLTLNIINSIFSFLLIMVYIYSTYNPIPFENLAWGASNFLIHTYFLCEYSIKIYVAKDRKIFFYSFESICDFFSLVPYFIIRFVLLSPFHEDFSDPWLNFSNLLCLLRMLKWEGCLIFIESEINRHLFSIILSITTLIIFCAGALQLVERIRAPDPNNEKEVETYNLQFDYYIYFVMFLISTVGFEMPFNKTEIKVFIIALIIVALLVIPTKSSQLITLLSSKSIYARRSYKIVQETPHIVITGTVSTIAAADFFQEFFHEDHGNQPRHACILLPHRPDPHMENLIRIPSIASNVFYIEGDPLQEKDLKRCQIEKAKAVIILCNKQSGDAAEEDAKTILRAMVIKKYLKLHNATNLVKLCMEILRPEGKTHYYLSLNRQTKADQVICVDELKLSLLAKSCLCPGLVALISNLITSSGQPKTEVEIKWLEEYWKGKQFEIYKTFLSPKFFGKSFSWVASKIYQDFRAIIIAIEIETEESTRILPNPGDFIIPFSQRVTGYIIAEDKKVADQIASYKSSETEKNITKMKTLANRKSYSSSIMSSFYNVDLLDNENEDDSGAEIGGKFKQENFNNYLSGDLNRLEEKCHISKSKIHLQDVNFLSMENNVLATNHIILCGLIPNLINFVLPLRSKYLTKYPPIVILHSKEPFEKQWSQIAYFPEIYYVKGTAMNKKDLMRANIMKASKVVILAPNVEEVKRKLNLDSNDKSNEPSEQEGDEETSSNRRKLTRDEEDLLDARTIFKYKMVKRIRPDIPIVTELVCPQNLVFILPNPKDYAIMRKFGHTQTPTFASGEIYFSSVIDSLICQSYYNSALITVLNQIIVGNSNLSSKKKDEFSDVKTSNLYHLHVPKAFHDETFEKLFHYLTRRQNILPLGLYRQTGLRDNKFPYVCTNPDPQTILSENDKIFVLAQNTPSELSTEWGAPFEKLAEKQINMASNVAVTEDLILNYDDMDKDLNKNKNLLEENKKVFENISKIIHDLKHLKNETDLLYERLNNRQEYIIEKVRDIISDAIKSVVPDNSNNNNPIVYDEDDMKTGSSPSSVENEQGEIEN